MYRLYIRFSLDDDNGSLTTKLANQLITSGLAKVGTGSYEGINLTQAQMTAVQADFWAALNNPQAAFPGVNIPPAVHIDHVWVFACGM